VVKSNTAPINTGLTTAYHWAQNQQAWSTGAVYQCHV